MVLHVSSFGTLTGRSAGCLFTVVTAGTLTFVSVPICAELLSMCRCKVVGIFVSAIKVMRILLALGARITVSHCCCSTGGRRSFGRFYDASVGVSSNI